MKRKDAIKVLNNLFDFGWIVKYTEDDIWILERDAK